MASGADFTYFVITGWPQMATAAKQALVDVAIQTSIATVRESLTNPPQAILKCRTNEVPSHGLLANAGTAYTHDEILALTRGNPHWEEPLD